jgi:hypothetical protein
MRAVAERVPSVDAYGSPMVMYVGSLKYPRVFIALIAGVGWSCGETAQR